MVVVLLLVLKFAALQAVLQHGSLWLLVIPIVARSSVLLLFLTTPYVRQDGLASVLVKHFPRGKTWGLLLILSLLLLLTGLPGLVIGGITLGAFYWVRRLMMVRLGGTTGDTAGAMIELLEAVLLVTVVCFYF
jgi:adenosylcobinamide-GDP ribazoletransferase